MAEVTNTDGFGAVSSFMVRRALALCYCCAFLNLVAQVDGLVGCDGIYPPKAKNIFSTLPYGGTPVVIMLIAVTGSLLAGAAFTAADLCERNAVATFVALWVLLAICVELTPQFYPMLEDKLILETGFVVLFLAGRHPGPALRCIQRIGRVLAAWLLFRFIYAGAAEKVNSTCATWRNLTALRDIYQMEPFPLPVAWMLSSLMPVPVVRALTALQLYVQMVLLPLVLAPWRVVSVSALSAQIYLVLVQCTLANQGCKPLCLAALFFASLDDRWHEATWGKVLLDNWGCQRKAMSEEKASSGHKDSKDEKETEREEDASEESEEEVAESSTDSQDQADVISWVVFLAFALGYAGILIGIFMRPAPNDASDADDRRVLRVFTLTIAVVAGTSAAVFTVAAAIGARGIPRFTRVPLVALGLTMWAAGSLQLSRDLEIQSSVPKTSSILSSSLERAHLVHALGAAVRGEVRICPDTKGRSDIVLRGAAFKQQWLQEAIDHLSPEEFAYGVQWFTLSSRFLPVIGSEERRPGWIQPYLPRLDYEIWRLANRNEKKQKEALGKWMNRLSVALAFREGTAARLSAGPSQERWNLLSNTDRGEARALTYDSMTPPAARMAVVRYRMKCTGDIHSNKWWQHSETVEVKTYDQQELIKLHKKLKPKCVAAPWAGWPVAEALGTLLLGAFLWSVVYNILKDGRAWHKGNFKKRKRR